MAKGLFKIDGHPDRAQAVSGMAHFSGGGPASATCNQCSHYGNSAVEKKCVKFREMTGVWGVNIKPATRACKYFEVKAKANA